MATKPIVTRILDEIEARLANIKTGNGYQRTVAKVSRATLADFSSADLPTVNFWTGTRDRAGAGGAFVDWQQPILVEIYDLTRERPFVDVVEEMVEDVAVALHRATSAPGVTDNPDPKLGGLVTTLQVTSVTPQIGQGQTPFCGALITFTALYKTRTDGITLASP